MTLYTSLYLIKCLTIFLLHNDVYNNAFNQIFNNLSVVYNVKPNQKFNKALVYFISWYENFYNLQKNKLISRYEVFYNLQIYKIISWYEKVKIKRKKKIYFFKFFLFLSIDFFQKVSIIIIRGQAEENKPNLCRNAERNLNHERNQENRNPTHPPQKRIHARPCERFTSYLQKPNRSNAIGSTC